MQRHGTVFAVPFTSWWRPDMPRLTPADYLFAIAFGLALGALVGFGI
jgi:hypothetical protein